MSPTMRTLLLQPLCEQLRLPPKEMFAILQSYFCQFPTRYHFISSLEEKITGIETQLGRLLPTLNQPNNATYHELITRHEQFVKMHDQQVTETKLLVLRFYLAERACLLENVSMVLTQASTGVEAI